MKETRIGSRISIALEREQDLEIGRRSGGEVVSGEEEPSLDLAFRRLFGERRLVKTAKGLAEPRSVEGDAVRATEGDERARLTSLR